MKTNLLTLVVTLTVGIILAGSLLMPVITDATTTERTYTNSGLYYMQSPIGADETYVYTFDADNGWEVDGESITTVANANIIVTDSFIVRASATNTIQLRGSIVNDAVSGTFTITSSGIDYEFTRASSQVITGSATYEYVYCAMPDSAPYIMTASTSPTNYVLGDSTIVGFGVTKVGTGYPTFKIVGTADSVTVTCVDDDDMVISNVQINKTAIDGYKNLYDFDSVTFTATKDDATVNATYNVVIIPSSVTAERSQHLDADQIALVSVLPILVIIGLVLAAVGVIFRNRD